MNEKVQFEVNRSVIKPASHSLLNEVAKIIKDHDYVKKVRVEGHASSEGDPAFNHTLSRARASAVKAFLVAAGVESSRVTSQGYGADKPIASNDTDEGRIKNRRVEFNIVEQDLSAKEAE